MDGKITETIAKITAKSKVFELLMKAGLEIFKIKAVTITMTCSHLNEPPKGP